MLLLNCLKLVTGTFLLKSRWVAMNFETPIIYPTYDMPIVLFCSECPYILLFPATTTSYHFDYQQQLACQVFNRIRKEYLPKSTIIVIIRDIYECANKTSGLYVDRNFIISSQDYRLLFLILKNSILLVVRLVTTYVYWYILYIRYI